MDSDQSISISKFLENDRETLSNNVINLTLKSIVTLKPKIRVVISKNGIDGLSYKKLYLFNNTWILEPKLDCMFVFKEIVTIPASTVGILLPSEEMSRTMMIFNTVQYQPGYHGPVSMNVTNGSNEVSIEKGSVVAKLVLLELAKLDVEYEDIFRRVWVKSTEGNCSYLVEGIDGLTVFPLPKGVTEEQGKLLAIIKALKNVNALKLEIIAGIGDPRRGKGKMNEIIRKACGTRKVTFK